MGSGMAIASLLFPGVLGGSCFSSSPRGYTGLHRGKHSSPDSAGIDWHHGLTGFAAEGVAELGHILDYAVHSKLPGGVGGGLHLQTELFGARAAAPALSGSGGELLGGGGGG